MPHQEDPGTQPSSGQPASGLLSHVALELRTRVASAAAAVEGLRDPTVTWTEEERSELLGVAHGSLAEVTLLLHELTAVGAQIGPLRRSPAQGTTLRDLLAAAVADLGEGVRRPHTRIPASLPPVLGDPLLLRLVLGSLLRHAVHTTGSSGPDVRAVRRNDRVLLRIGDNPPDRRWSSPTRLSSVPLRWDQDTPLDPDVTVARALAHLLGGALRVADENRRGRSIVLELPAAPASGTPEQHPHT